VGLDRFLELEVAGGIRQREAVIRHGQVRLLRFDGREVDVEASAVKVQFEGETCVQLEMYQVSDPVLVTLPK